MKCNRSYSEYRRLVADLLRDRDVRSMSGFVQHGRTSTLRHSLMVSYLSYRLCRRLRFYRHLRSVARGALLHDFYLYDWHVKGGHQGLHGFNHPRKALDNAQSRFELDAVEANIIYSHMWPLTLRQIPVCREAVIVCLVDKYCSLLETLSR